jgi:hypothetical protein
MINWTQLGILLGIGAIHARKAFDRLSPAAKQKLAAIVRWGVAQAARYTLTSVLGDVGNQVIQQVINDPQVAEAAKALVKRGIDVGAEAVLREADLA